MSKQYFLVIDKGWLYWARFKGNGSLEFINPFVPEGHSTYELQTRTVGSFDSAKALFNNLGLEYIHTDSCFAAETFVKNRKKNLYALAQSTARFAKLSESGDQYLCMDTFLLSKDAQTLRDVQTWPTGEVWQTTGVFVRPKASSDTPVVLDGTNGEKEEILDNGFVIIDGCLPYYIGSKQLHVLMYAKELKLYGFGHLPLYEVNPKWSCYMKTAEEAIRYAKSQGEEVHFAEFDNESTINALFAMVEVLKKQRVEKIEIRGNGCVLIDGMLPYYANNGFIPPDTLRLNRNGFYVFTGAHIHTNYGLEYYVGETAEESIELAKRDGKEILHVEYSKDDITLEMLCEGTPFGKKAKQVKHDLLDSALAGSVTGNSRSSLADTDMTREHRPVDPVKITPTIAAPYYDGGSEGGIYYFEGIFETRVLCYSHGRKYPYFFCDVLNIENPTEKDYGYCRHHNVEKSIRKAVEGGCKVQRVQLPIGKVSNCIAELKAKMSVDDVLSTAEKPHDPTGELEEALKRINIHKGAPAFDPKNGLGGVLSTAKGMADNDIKQMKQGVTPQSNRERLGMIAARPHEYVYDGPQQMGTTFVSRYRVDDEVWVRVSDKLVKMKVIDIYVSCKNGK